jgi:hypothetical protein
LKFPFRSWAGHVEEKPMYKSPQLRLSLLEFTKDVVVEFKCGGIEFRAWILCLRLVLEISCLILCRLYHGFKHFLLSHVYSEKVLLISALDSAMDHDQLCVEWDLIRSQLLHPAIVCRLKTAGLSIFRCVLGSGNILLKTFSAQLQGAALDTT